MILIGPFAAFVSDRRGFERLRLADFALASSLVSDEVNILKNAGHNPFVIRLFSKVALLLLLAPLARSAFAVTPPRSDRAKIVLANFLFVQPNASAAFSINPGEGEILHRDKRIVVFRKACDLDAVVHVWG